MQCCAYILKNVTASFTDILARYEECTWTEMKFVCFFKSKLQKEA